MQAKSGHIGCVLHDFESAETVVIVQIASISKLMASLVDELGEVPTGAFAL